MNKQKYCQSCDSDENLLICVKCSNGMCENCFDQFGGKDFEALCPTCSMLSVFRQAQIEICEACADIHESEQEELSCLCQSINAIKDKMNQLYVAGTERSKRIEQLRQQIQINENEINMLKSKIQ